LEYTNYCLDKFRRNQLSAIGLVAGGGILAYVGVINEQKEIARIKTKTKEDGIQKELDLLNLEFKQRKEAYIEKYGEETELLKLLEEERLIAIAKAKKKWKDKEIEERAAEIAEIANNTSQVAGLYSEMFNNIADSAEDGSIRQKNARKASITADLIAGTASTIGAIAEAIAKAQSLMFPLNLIEGIRIAGLGAVQLSKIASARSQIAKMQHGGSGVFEGASHSQGGIRFGNVEVEGGEPFWVMPKNASAERVGIMNKVFEDLQRGKTPNFSPNNNINVSVNDEYQKKIYDVINNKSENGQNYREVKQGNHTRRIYN